MIKITSLTDPAGHLIIVYTENATEKYFFH